MSKVNVTIEIPKNSKIKYEFDRKTKEISVDRVLYGSCSYPQNYGFIKNTLDWDGDELDAIVLSDQPIFPGCNVKARIIGAVEMIDNGEVDTKLLTVIDSDPRYNNINSLSDVSENILLEIQDFFTNYKNLEDKKVIVKGFRNIDWAVNEYIHCIELMDKYGSLDKEEFIEKMKMYYPEKYKF